MTSHVRLAKGCRGRANGQPTSGPFADATAPPIAPPRQVRKDSRATVSQNICQITKVENDQIFPRSRSLNFSPRCRVVPFIGRMIALIRKGVDTTTSELTTLTLPFAQNDDYSLLNCRLDRRLYNRPFSLVGLDVGQEGGVAVSFAESAEGFVKYSSSSERQGKRRNRAQRSLKC